MVQGPNLLEVFYGLLGEEFVAGSFVLSLVLPYQRQVLQDVLLVNFLNFQQLVTEQVWPVIQFFCLLFCKRLFIELPFRQIPQGGEYFSLPFLPAFLLVLVLDY